MPARPKANPEHPSSIKTLTKPTIGSIIITVPIPTIKLSITRIWSYVFKPTGNGSSQIWAKLHSKWIYSNISIGSAQSFPPPFLKESYFSQSNEIWSDLQLLRGYHMLTSELLFKYSRFVHISNSLFCSIQIRHVSSQYLFEEVFQISSFDDHIHYFSSDSVGLHLPFFSDSVGFGDRHQKSVIGNDWFLSKVNCSQQLTLEQRATSL